MDDKRTYQIALDVESIGTCPYVSSIFLCGRYPTSDLIHAGNEKIFVQRAWMLSLEPKSYVSGNTVGRSPSLIRQKYGTTQPRVAWRTSTPGGLG